MSIIQKMRTWEQRHLGSSPPWPLPARPVHRQPGTSTLRSPPLRPWFCRSLQRLEPGLGEDPGMPGTQTQGTSLPPQGPGLAADNQFPGIRDLQAPHSGLCEDLWLPEACLSQPFLSIYVSIARDDRLLRSILKRIILIQFGFGKLHTVWECDRQSEPGVNATARPGPVILSQSAVDELEVRPQHSTTAPQHHRIA